MIIRPIRIASYIAFALSVVLLAAPLTASSQVYAETTAFVRASSGTVSPGEVFTISAGGGPLNGGMTLGYSTGVTIVGEPTCYVPCGDYWINKSTRGFGVNSLGSEINVGLQFQVEETAELGSWIHFTVTIVGGNPNIRMSSTSVQVIAAVSSPPIDAATETGANVTASAFTSPQVILVEPEGSFYVDVLHNISGLSPNQNVQPVLWVTLPQGITMLDKPLCGNEPFFSQLAKCDNFRERDGTNTPLIFNPVETSIVLHLKVDASMKAGTTLEVRVRLTTSVSAASVESPLVISVVEYGTLPTPRMTEKIVGLELYDNYEKIGSNVCAPIESPDLSLYSWGDFGATLYSSDAEYSAGMIIKSSIDEEQMVCRIYVRFLSVPSSIERMLLATTSEPGFLCRACVLGSLLPTEKAIIVVSVGYIPSD